MNILKQGMEFSPIGLATLPGAKDKTAQLAKSLIGSSVLLGSSWLAAKGDSTWAVPSNAKEKALFYASGKMPYSIKIGDKWVSYSRLGPLAFPIAMAAAIKYHDEQSTKSLSDSDFEKMTKVLAGTAQFFSDQSYLEGVGNFIDLAKGDVESTGRILTGIPTQLVPLSSLQRWAANLIDPIYRKTGAGLTPEAIIDNLKKGIPFLSKQLQPYKDIYGEPSKRSMPILNAVSPIGVSKEKSEEAGIYESYMDMAKYRAEVNKIKKEIRKSLGL
jgi:hypothetical protein